MIYSVDEDGIVWISLDADSIPFLKQPTWPDGTEWAKGEAEAWAKQFILAAEDPTALLPGDNPNEPTKARPEATPEA
jgi:hypothetical protein